MRSFALHQRIRYDYDRPVTRLHQRLLVVPPSAHGAQRRTAWRLRVEGAEAVKIREPLDGFGNTTVDVAVPKVDGHVEFVVDAEVVVHPAPLAGHAVAADPRYLAPTRLTAPDGALRALAAGVGRPDPAALCAAAHQALAYEWGVTGVGTSAADALDGGRGVCRDYAHILLALCRLVGLPARYVSGHLVGEGGSHAWVEILRPDRRLAGCRWSEGWDPTHDRPAGADHLVVAVGRDYHDVAPMSGSYATEDAANVLTVSKRLAVTDPGAPALTSPVP